MKSKRKAVLWGALVLAIILGTILVWQIFFSASISLLGARTCEMESFSFDSLKDEYHALLAGEEGDGQLLSNQTFAFENAKDYETLYIYFEVKNNSLLDVNNLQFYIKNPGQHQDVFLVKMDTAIDEEISRFSARTIMLGIDIYRGSKSDAEIINAIKDLQVELTGTRSILPNINLSIEWDGLALDYEV